MNKNIPQKAQVGQHKGTFSSGASVQKHTGMEPSKSPTYHRKASGVDNRRGIDKGQVSKHYDDASARPSISKGRTMPRGVSH